MHNVSVRVASWSAGGWHYLLLALSTNRFPAKRNGQALAMRARAVPVELENNDKVVITEWRFAPGAETGMHRHALDYVIVYRTAARHLVQTTAVETRVEIAEGHSYFRRAGVEHNVINVGPNEVVLVETELK